ncbi:glycosyltransferase family A protein [uncultured Polaribacter sp.]|uniref:glycosyltransferase family A protein n=1 Tax=uncultured Polaribacter sp. TaxID=174711 RepID=UPI002635F283|nr:glycosyltransferase family A protein [uncultured Polaribacter sp.]
MRKGVNPNNHKTINAKSISHRVIIPVYIPNFEGYFKDSLNVFKVCVESLLKTINSDTVISIISNASCKEVNNYIYSLKQDNKIDRAIFNKENVGKMNAIIAETRASFEKFITYSDADVFFDKGWLKQTYTMFKNVPNAGFISMNPTPQNYGYSESTLLSNLNILFFQNKKTEEVCSRKDLIHFHKSIGKPEEFTVQMLESKILTLENHNYIMGAGHFCCTIKKTPTLNFVPMENSNKFASGGSEALYLDIPFNKTGLLKLSSPKSYVWHMGNVLEKDWTLTKLDEISTFKEDDFSFDSLPSAKANLILRIIPYRIRLKIIGFLKKVKFIKLK